MKLLKYILCSILFTILCIPNTCIAKDISIEKNDGIYHIVLKGEKIKKKIKFVASEDLITNREAHIKGRSILTINAGFFDPKNGKTISYIITDRMTAADPMFNSALLANPFFRKNMKTILNRSEFRIMQCGNKFEYSISPHSAEVPFSCSLETSAQGGPLIYPDLKLEEEGFIVKDKDGKVIRESASVLHKTSRTIIGIKGTNECHILIITDENPMDMYEVHELCKKLGLDRAMAFDGGSSTSMNYKNKLEVISKKGDGAGRMLKSFMIIQK
ncbi:MAG: phosphodiester glycosidase family protein [Cyanobacteria bacterium SIG26]|nr:phosphodiester glycosidase family protein [Cyanobacteria bacterium SIG26]